MRIRYVKGAKELIKVHPSLIIDNVENTIINFKDIFKNDNKIHIEIGMGKGKFIYTLAQNNPTINYIGIERFDSVIVRALKKLIASPLDNLILLRLDANDLLAVFSENSIDRIYLNFSDPWPKIRHEKRRLTNKNFLKRYQKLMTKNAELHFKTDNNDLFDFSVEEITNYPMDITFQTRDLQNSEYINNVMTEFEEKYSKLGKKISMLKAIFMEE